MLQIDEKDNRIIEILEEDARYRRSEKNLSGVASGKAERLIVKLADRR